MSIRIIGEAGSNHGGIASRAKELALLASNSGADSVKFQFINPEELYLPSVWVNGTLKQSSVFTQRKREILSAEEWREVWEYSVDLGIAPSASVFDIRGIKQAVDLKCSYIKIASTDLNYHRLIEAAIETSLPIIVSTGMSTLSQVEKTVDVFFKKNATQRLTLLHCVSVYPCPLENAGLARIKRLRYAFGVPVGYSDHTLGFAAACAAVALGATVIEKHFTTDKDLPGFDHAHASGPSEFQLYCQTLRAVSEQMTGVASCSDESVTAVRARRGLYAARDLPAGHEVSASDILCVRPSSDLAADQFDMLVGMVITSPLRKHEAFAIENYATAGSSNAEAANRYWQDEMKDKSMDTGDES